VHLWVRAKPGDRTAAVVVHAVDWNAPGPTAIRLNHEQLFGGKPLRVTLRVPTPYDADAHKQAEAEQRYGALATERRLNPKRNGSWCGVELPPVSPWGILVIRPAE